MNLKDCKVTLMLNMHTGFSAGSVQEDILQDILKIVCPKRKVQWEYHDGFIQCLQDAGFDVKSALRIPNFYIQVVGGYGACFTVTSISDLFRECFEHGFEVDI